jgi:hypothetical protein
MFEFKSVIVGRGRLLVVAVGLVVVAAAVVDEEAAA